jgi:hypothetical protein
MDSTARGGRLCSQALCLGQIGRKAAGTLIDNAMKTDEGKAGVTVGLLAAALFGAAENEESLRRYENIGA